VNQHNILIDGWHRWTAHRSAEKATIEVVVTETKSEREIRLLAIKRNNNHGWQLTDDSKRREAIWLYAAGTGSTKEKISDCLSVTLRMVNNYLENIDKQLREERKQIIRDMYLACHTQDEIAAAVDRVQQTITDEIKTFTDFGSVSKTGKTHAFHQEPDFTPPLYNVWTFAKKTNSVKHFGNSEQRILDNLLYLYTEPFDIVLDPFAGGGSTIEVCKKRLRRYWVSDRKPIVERETEIRKLDIAQELPPLAKRWSEVTLTFLDPPYWKQAEGEYSEDAEDLANMTLEAFTTALANVIKQISRKQSKGVIAMLMQPTQWRAPNREYTDHVFDIVQAVGNKRLILENRVSVPYSTEQCNAQMVEWAKENHKLLGINRELVIWRLDDWLGSNTPTRSPIATNRTMPLALQDAISQDCNWTP